MPSQTSLSARAALIALTEDVAAGRGAGFPGLSSLPASADARSSAVLILFGILDGLPSDHRAASEAVSSDLDILLLERAATLRAHPGQVAFPGGRLDPDDSGPVDAALREAQEETGLDPAGVEVLGMLERVPLAFSQNLVTPVVGWWRHPSEVGVVDEAESAAVFRAPIADLLDPAQRGVTVIRRDGRQWSGPGFTVERDGREFLVWGFTAMLLDGLFDRLGWTEPWDRTRELPLNLNGQPR